MVQLEAQMGKRGGLQEPQVGAARLRQKGSGNPDALKAVAGNGVGADEIEPPALVTPWPPPDTRYSPTPPAASTLQ